MLSAPKAENAISETLYIPIVQNLPGEHAPGPPKQLAPSALVIGTPNKSNLATALKIDYLSKLKQSSILDVF